MVGAALLVVSTHHDAAYRPLLLSPSSRGPQEFHSPGSRNHARLPHCLRWGGMASLLGGLGDRFPQHNRDLPSKAPPLAAGIFTLTERVPSSPTLRRRTSARAAAYAGSSGAAQSMSL